MSVPRFWLTESECYLCHTALGHGTYRPKKLHCHLCHHAICSTCSHPSSTHFLCSLCTNSPPNRSETPISDLNPPESPLKEPSFDAGSAISDASEDGQALNSVITSAKQLVTAMNSHSRIEKDHMSVQIVKYSQQLRNRHAEIELLRDQEQWYAQQLVDRDAEIKELGYDVAVLSSRNYDLATQVKQLEQRRKPLTSMPHPRATGCCDSHSCIVL